MNAVKDKIWFLREGLFAKYVMALVGLVVFVLAVNGAIEIWISYRGIKTSLNDGMSEKAEATAKQIQQSMADLERQISWATRAYSNTVDLRRADYAQLLRQVPQVSQLSLLNAQGREQLRVTRRTVTGRQQRSISPATSRFTEAISRGTGYAPAYFRGERPFMTIALSHSDSNVTVAEIDLGFLTEFLGRRPGRQGGVCLCRRRQGASAGELRRRGRMSARTCRRCRRSPPSSSPAARRWRPAPIPRAMTC